MGSQLAAKGTSRSFIAPIILEGSPVAMLDNVDIRKMAIVWDALLIMYVVGDKTSIGEVIRYIAKKWNPLVSHMSFFMTRDILLLNSAQRRIGMLCWLLDLTLCFGRPMITKPWSSDFNFQEEILRVVPVWVKFPHLPLSCWGTDSLSRIGSLIGVPLFADECTSKQPRISFARMLIEVDVTKDISKSVSIQDSVGRYFTQNVEYEWLPLFARSVMFLVMIVM